MTMRRGTHILAGILFLVLTPTVALGTTPARRPLIVTSQDHSLIDADSCKNFHTTTLTSLPAAARSEEQRNVHLNEARQLKVLTATEGGVAVQGWDRPYARLTVCKAAVALSDTEARKTLAGITVSVSANEIVARGPELNANQTWWVNMILWVPRSARIDVTSTNGGISIRNMAGHITARATNGGISIASCGGDNDLTTKNGGISIDKVSGRVNAVTESGSISLKLRNLDLPTLEAITLHENGEIVCNVKGCADGVGEWAADRKRLRIGHESTPSIRLTSVSADIMIEQVR
jgi:hypothetical protein